jgi:hypothetical protein
LVRDGIGQVVLVLRAETTPETAVTAIAVAVEYWGGVFNLG